MWRDFFSKKDMKYHCKLMKEYCDKAYPRGRCSVTNEPLTQKRLDDYRSVCRCDECFPNQYDKTIPIQIPQYVADKLSITESSELVLIVIDDELRIKKRKHTS